VPSIAGYVPQLSAVVHTLDISFSYLYPASTGSELAQTHLDEMHLGDEQRLEQSA